MSRLVEKRELRTECLDIMKTRRPLLWEDLGRSRREEAGRCRLGMNLGKSRPRFGLLSVPLSTFDVSVNNRFSIMVLDLF